MFDWQPNTQEVKKKEERNYEKKISTIVMFGFGY